MRYCGVVVDESYWEAFAKFGITNRSGVLTPILFMLEHALWAKYAKELSN